MLNMSPEKVILASMAGDEQHRIYTSGHYTKVFIFVCKFHIKAIHENLGQKHEENLSNNLNSMTVTVSKGHTANPSLA